MLIFFQTNLTDLKSDWNYSECLKSEHAEIQAFCVYPKNPEYLKSECTEIQTGLRLDFGTV